MPSKPLRPCNKVGCTELTQSRYCKQHEVSVVKQYDKERGTAAQRGYGSRWRKARNTFLSHHPLCVECERNGRAVPATVVDHIIAHKGNTSLFWDKNNWQSMCSTCHNRKTVRSDGGFGNVSK